MGQMGREGLHRGKSSGRMVPRAGERHRETEKITKPGGKWRQRGRVGAGLLSA